MMNRLSVVILTHNRAGELQRTLEHMLALPEHPPIVVVDNASTDGTADLLAEGFPMVKLIRLDCNLGAAARNLGVREVDTPYVAFCDDDTWWLGGTLARAIELLDAHPDVAVLSARVLVGTERTEDPTCALMADSPLPRGELPGPALLGFMAGAAVVRRAAFLAAGGYEPRFFIGGEEALLTLDLRARGWHIVYAPELTVRHIPSPQRDSAGRRMLLVRNALWVAWMRLPPAMLLRETARILREATHDKAAGRGVIKALRGLPWVMRRRKVISPDVARLYRMLHG